jgi:hypothetical protein
MLTFHGNPRERLGLPDAAFSWSDYYASADPVSNGPLYPPGKQPDDQAPDDETLRTPKSCHQVYNSGSVMFDHNGYLRNQDELVTSVVNDLVSAAYGEDASALVQPMIADCVEEASNRRKFLVHWLVAIRILTVAVLVAAWWRVPGWALRRPLNQVMHLSGTHAAMGDGPARLVTAVLAAAAFYLIAVAAWRAAMDRSVQKFFDSAQPPAKRDSTATPVPAAENDLSSAIQTSGAQTAHPLLPGSRMTPVP